MLTKGLCDPIVADAHVVCRISLGNQQAHLSLISDSWLWIACDFSVLAVLCTYMHTVGKMFSHAFMNVRSYRNLPDQFTQLPFCRISLAKYFC